MPNREWFRINLKAAEKDAPPVAEIHIVDVIGGWQDQMWNEMLDVTSPITAKHFLGQLAAIPADVKAIRVHVNSPGGDVYAALNIANALREQKTAKGRSVEMVIDGLAASAASVIIMAGDKIRMADNALVMIHNPWTRAIGNAAEMRKSAEVLDKIRDMIIATYGWHSALTDQEIGAMMDAETWMNADEAVANGFADEKITGQKVAATFDQASLVKLEVPEKYKAHVDALIKKPEPTPAPPARATADEVMSLCGEAALDLPFARTLAKEGLTVEAATARITAEKETRALAAARAKEIRAICAKAKQDDIADDLVAGGMTTEQVRSHLAKITAKLDKAEIDANISPNQGTPRGGAVSLDVNAIYAERNGLRPAGKE